MGFHFRSWVYGYGNKTFPTPSHGNKIEENVGKHGCFFVPGNYLFLGLFFCSYLPNKGMFNSNVRILGIFFLEGKQTPPKHLEVKSKFYGCIFFYSSTKNRDRYNDWFAYNLIEWSLNQSPKSVTKMVTRYCHY